MNKRKIKYTVYVDSTAVIHAPYEEVSYDLSNDFIRVDRGQFPGNYTVIHPNNEYYWRAHDPWQNGNVAGADDVSPHVGYENSQEVFDDEYDYYIALILKNWPTREKIIEDDLTGGNYEPIIDLKYVFNPRDPNIGYYYNQLPTGWWPILRDHIEDKRTNYFKTVGGQVDLYSDFLGFKVQNLVFCARWFNIVHDGWDKSGRGMDVTTQQTYNPNVGIGKPDRGFYNGKISVRAHWIPQERDCTDFDGALKPDWRYLKPTEFDHYAFRKYDDPRWDSVSDPGTPLDPIQNHVMLCMATDGHPTLILDSPPGTAWDHEPLGTFESWVSRYAFYAWPIKHFWRAGSMGTNKVNWEAISPWDNADWTGDIPENNRE